MHMFCLMLYILSIRIRAYDVFLFTYMHMPAAKCWVTVWHMDLKKLYMAHMFCTNAYAPTIQGRWSSSARSVRWQSWIIKQRFDWPQRWTQHCHPRWQPKTLNRHHKSKKDRQRKVYGDSNLKEINHWRATSMESWTLKVSIILECLIPQGFSTT